MAKTKKNTNTAQARLNKEYSKVRKNVLANYRRLLRQGYAIDVVIPERPKKVTQASIRNIGKFTPAYFRQRAEYITETGEIIAGTEAPTYRRREAQISRPLKQKYTPTEPQEYYPEQRDIIRGNALAILAKVIYIAEHPREYDPLSWWRRSRVARIASEQAGKVIAARANKLLASHDNDFFRQLEESASRENLWDNLQKAMYASSSYEVEASMVVVLSILSGGTLGAKELKALSDMEEEYEGEY